MNKYQGSCHCGRIAYEVEADIPEVTQCNCSHCSRKGYLLAFLPRKQVAMKTPDSNLSTYKFNKHRITHHFCNVCGCAPIAFGRDSKGNEVASINVRCLPDFDLSKVKINPFDGLKL